MIPKDKKKQWASNDLPVDIRKQWMEHIGGVGASKFPRDVGFPTRFPVDNFQELIEVVEDKMTNSNAYVQLFSDIQREADVYDTFYIDIDVEMPFDADEGTADERRQIWEEKIEDAYWEVQKYIWHMESTYNADLRVYFSGSRGFSIYVDFEQIQTDWLAVIDTIEDTLHDADVDQDMIDESVYDKTANRITRLPYTLNWNHHKKRGLDPLFCLPVDTSWDFETVLNEIKNPHIYREVERNGESNLVREYILQHERTKDYESERVNTETTIQLNPEASLDRVQVLMDLAEHIRDGRHRILHFMLVPALIEAGWEDRARIHDMCEEFVEKTGASYYPEYYQHVEKGIPRTLEGPEGSDGHWKPWTVETFLRKNPELFQYFDASVID